MPLYLVAYDLNKPDQNYKAVDSHLEALKAVRILQSTWLVRSRSSAETILNNLINGPFDQNDKGLVVSIGSWASYGTPVDIDDL